MSKEIMEANINRAQKFIDENKAAALGSDLRQQYHFMPEEGWMNDPNGLVMFRGMYHFFYQYNPYDTVWGEMYWGHAVSKDMIHWQYLPVALAPSEDYDDFKGGGCFSGSAIVKDDRLYLIYTGAFDQGRGMEQAQCIAWSDDGVTFEKYDENPIVRVPDGYDDVDFRDPCVWEHDGSYYMVCGAAKNDLAQALIFRSSDLLKWEFVNVMAESHGDLGTMWECPDLFRMGDRYVLMISPIGMGNRTKLYMIGDFDYETCVFTFGANSDVDYGMDYYAPKSFLDSKGRRLIVAWSNSWSWMPWWKDFGPTGKDGWCGSFNLVREVRLNDDDTLSFVPISEYKELRRDALEINNVVVSEDLYIIRNADGPACEILVSFDLNETDADRIIFRLREGSGHHTGFVIDLKQRRINFSRDNADEYSKGTVSADIKGTSNGEMKVHIFIDRTSVEIFTDDYRTCLSDNIYPDPNQTMNSIQVENGKAMISSLESYKLVR